MKKINVLLFLFFLLLQLNAQKFTIPVFPDTQCEVDSKPEMLESQVDWIIKNKEKLNIPLVLHVGDVANYDNFTHWEIAGEYFAKFDKARIPYAIALGNHDTEAVGEYSGSAAPGNVNQNLRKTFKFNSYFPTSRFIAQRGRYEPGKSDNAYYTFRVGNTNWLVVVLEFCPRQGPINWAGDVIKAYHEYNVILLTHYHLSGKGEIVQNNAGYGDFSPQFVFDRLIKVYPNIRLVLSGHVMSSALKVDTGINNNKIYQILQNYQGEDFGGGYLRLLHFDLEKGTISAEMYSPYYNLIKKDDSKYLIENFEFVKPGKKK
ncbi:metallophosphoesterase [Parabacteroides sp. Marseille-P3160]|uniref:metallophosphoesterase n=1 Tax=Parabacteroides sp. Marseille-P3160 TaxID=1917887 RepID=UPI0009B9C47B|nr:metallophosphoesterase [Parabacteroides sp. Marseille-P3160]